MNGGIKTLSVKQKILDATHGRALGRPDWDLAQFLLLHYDEIDRLRTRDLAEICHISPSTVRRFCQSLGYDNFSDLRRAKCDNPENQYEIAVENWKNGLYQPRRLYDESRDALWEIGQKTDWAAFGRLADEMLAADAALIFALRPYTFILQEFQSQYASLGRQLFIFDSVVSAAPVIERATRLCCVTLSLAGVLFPAIDAPLCELAGFKAAVYCPRTLRETGSESCLDHYDARFPIHARTQEYNYLELYGKYAVMYFFDMLLGLLVERRA